LLIADYSSVVWDLYYLSKPVICYQFDKEECIQDQGMFLGLNKELVGGAFVSKVDVVNSV